MRNFVTALHQNMIAFLKSSALWVVAIMPIFILFTIGTIYPASWILPQIITLSIIIVCFLSVGIQYNNYRKTNFFRTTKNTSVSVLMIVIGTVITVSTVSFFMTIFLMILTFLFTIAVPVLCQTVDNVNIEAISEYREYIQDTAFFSTFSFETIQWLKLIYSLLISVLMTSLLAVMIANLVKNEKAYIVISLFYIIIYILLGGILFPLAVVYQSEILKVLSILIPNVHTNSLLISSLNNSMSQSLEGFTEYVENLRKWLIDVAYSENGVYNPNFSVLFDNSIHIEGDDLLYLPAIFSIAPWLTPAAIEVFAIIGDLTGMYSTNDVYGVLRIMFIIIGAVQMFGNTDHAGFSDFYIGTYQVTQNLWISLNSIYFAQNAFEWTTFGMTSNIIPLFIMAISLPTFIKVVRT